MGEQATLAKSSEANIYAVVIRLLTTKVNIMTTQEADEKLEIISQLAREIEEDEELKKIDERYSITAKWIDTDIEGTSV